MRMLNKQTKDTGRVPTDTGQVDATSAQTISGRPGVSINAFDIAYKISDLSETDLCARKLLDIICHEYNRLSIRNEDFMKVVTKMMIDNVSAFIAAREHRPEVIQ